MAKEDRKKVRVEIEVELDDKELADRSRELAVKMRERKELESQHKDIRKRLKLKEDQQDEEIEELRESVETGKAREERECLEEPDYKKGIVKVYDPKGKFLHDRKMTDEERQTNIKGLEKALGNRPDGNPVAEGGGKKPEDGEEPDDRA